jgi:hypothetical protein
MTDPRSLRADIVGAVAAVRYGDQDHAALLLSRLTGASDLRMRQSVRELVAANVQMVYAAVPEPEIGSGDHAVAFAVDGADVEGRPVPIDDFEPAQRAATRIMLALANDRPEDVETQLDIVSDAPGENEMGLVFVHTLYWTLDLLDVCEQLNRGVPDWLRPASAMGSQQ